MIPGVTPNGFAEELEVIKPPVVVGNWSYPYSIIIIITVFVIVFTVVVVILVARQQCHFGSLLDIRGKINAVQAQDA